MNLPRPGDTKYTILEAIDSHWKSHPRGPTVEELRAEVGLTRRSSVQFHIDDLRQMGLVEGLPRRARTIRPTMRGKKLLKLMANFGGDYPIGVTPPNATPSASPSQLRVPPAPLDNGSPQSQGE